MATTLQTYITACQRLMHDSTYKFCTQTELTDYANQARRKVAAETGCVRQIVTGVTLAQAATTVNYANIIANRRVIGVLDIYIWASTGLRVALRYFPYSIFSRSAVVMYHYQGLPEMWSQVGPGLAYIARIPDIAYTLDIDVSLEPSDLSVLTDPEAELISPFTECVQYYMSYLVKLKNQQYDEADRYLLYYEREKRSCGSSTMIRKLVGA